MSQNPTSYSIHATNKEGILTVTLHDHVQQITYSSQYLQQTNYEGINKKMDFQDIYLSLSCARNSGKQKDRMGQVQESIESQLSRKFFGEEQPTFYQIQKGGVVYVYMVLFDFRTKDIIEYESKLVLDIVKQNPVKLPESNPNPRGQKLQISHVSISSISESFQACIKEAPDNQEASKSSQQSQSVSLDSQDINHPEIIEDHQANCRLCERSIFDEEKSQSKQNYCKSMCNREAQSLSVEPEISITDAIRIGLQSFDKPMKQVFECSMKKDKRKSEIKTAEDYGSMKSSSEQEDEQSSRNVIYDGQSNKQKFNLEDLLDAEGLSSVAGYRQYFKTEEFKGLQSEEKVKKIQEILDPQSLELMKKKLLEEYQDKLKQSEQTLYNLLQKYEQAKEENRVHPDYGDDDDQISVDDEEMDYHDDGDEENYEEDCEEDQYGYENEQRPCNQQEDPDQDGFQCQYDDEDDY